MPTGALRLHSTIEWREVGGEIVALNLDRSEYLAANRTGTAIWRLLSEGTTHEALIHALASEHCIERSTAIADVSAFLSELEAQGCLERAEDD